MEIQSLKMLVSDADIASFAQPYLRDQDGIEEVVIRLTPEGVLLQGKYSTGFGFKVSFETLWQVRCDGPCLLVTLTSVKVANMPGNMLRGALMRMVHDNIEGQAGLTVEGDSIRIHVPQAARAQGTDLQINFTEVRLSIGAAVVEAS